MTTDIYKEAVSGIKKISEEIFELYQVELIEQPKEDDLNTEFTIDIQPIANNYSRTKVERINLLHEQAKNGKTAKIKNEAISELNKEVDKLNRGYSAITRDNINSNEAQATIRMIVNGIEFAGYNKGFRKVSGKYHSSIENAKKPLIQRTLINKESGAQIKKSITNLLKAKVNKSVEELELNSLEVDKEQLAKYTKLFSDKLNYYANHVKKMYLIDIHKPDEITFEMIERIYWNNNLKTSQTLYDIVVSYVYNLLGWDRRIKDEYRELVGEDFENNIIKPKETILEDQIIIPEFKSLVQRFVLLHELGIIDYLKKTYDFDSLPQPKQVALLSWILGFDKQQDKEHIQSVKAWIRYLGTSNKNNPLKNEKNIEFINGELIKMGIKSIEKVKK